MKKIKYRSKLRIFLGRRMLIAFMILAQLVLILALIMRGSQLRWLSYVLSALSVATALHLITRPDKYAFKILWTFLILLFPLFGGVMYWMFHFQTAYTGFRKILRKPVDAVWKWNVQYITPPKSGKRRIRNVHKILKAYLSGRVMR